MGCIWREQHSWDYTSWRGIKAFTVNTTEQPGMLWLENPRCSLSLPLSRAPLLFQLRFGGSPTSLPLLPNDSWQMPSLYFLRLLLVMSFHPSERSSPCQQRSCGSHPRPGGTNQTQPSPNKLTTHGVCSDSVDS